MKTSALQSRLRKAPVRLILLIGLARSDQAVGGVSGHLDTVRLGLTFPLGQREVATPVNSVARAAMAPLHNALTTFTDTLF